MTEGDPTDDDPRDEAPAERAHRTEPDLERENRQLQRRLQRLEDNVRTLEAFQDSNATLLSRLLKDLEEERERSHRLLLNVLPQRIIDRLGAGETVIADRHDDVTVLLGDLVGFTRISAELEPSALVEALDNLFSTFDAICAETAVEKIKTVGDAYLVVGGLPGGAPDHAAAIAETALRMTEAVAGRNDDAWAIRIGITRGPIVAGVIGSSKFAYDVWGDTVNLASRLQGAASPGAIVVGGSLADSLGEAFALEPLGAIDLKGKGPTPAWSLRRAVGRPL